MAQETRDLLVRIQGDASGFKRAMVESDKTTKDGERSFEEFQQTARNVAVALGAVGAALIGYAKSATDFTVDYVREARQVARVTGDTVTESSRLMAAFRRLGLDTSEITTTFNALSKKVIAAKDDAGDANNAFQRLGIGIKNADGSTRALSGVLFDIADRFKTMPDGIDKNALALELFGRSGSKLIPLLNRGSEGIREMEAEADRLGLTLTDKTIGAVSQYIESQKQLKATSDALKIAVGSLTAPVLAQFQTKVNEVAQALIGTDGPLRNLTANVLAFGGPVAAVAATVAGFLGDLGGSMPIFQAFGISLGGVGSALGTLALIIAGVGAAVGAIVYAFGGWNETLKLLKTVYDEWIKPALERLWTQIQIMLVPALQRLWEQIGPVLLPVLKVLGLVLGSVVIGSIMATVYALQVLIFIISQVINWLSFWVGHVRATVTEVLNIFRAIPHGIRATMDAAADAIIGPIARAFNWIKGNVNEVREALKKISPFARQSPSLVDLVKAGTRVITQQYGQMFNEVTTQADQFNNRQLGAALPGVEAGQPGAGAPAGAAQATGPVNFNLNLGMYAGMPIEKREIAVSLWREIVREARSQGVQLPQIGVNVQ